MRKFLITLGLFCLFAGNVNATTYAMVNGEPITDQDMLFLKQAMPNVDFNTLPKEMKEKAIDQAIERKLLIGEAKKYNFEDTKEYKEALAEFKDQMTLELWMRKQLEGVKVSDSELKKYYNSNKDKMVIPEQAYVRHILVDNEKEAKEIIKELDQTAKEGKNVEAKFIELAKADSKDPSASNGGELPPFAREGQMIPEFSKAAFALKPNTYTEEPVKTQFGYHIIYLKSIQPKGIVKFEDIKPRLEEDLKMQKFRDMMAKEAADLKKKAKIEILVK